MKLIYDGPKGERVRIGRYVFIGGEVSSEINDDTAAHLLAQPHLRFRKAADEVAPKVSKPAKAKASATANDMTAADAAEEK